ncbi:pyridine nucleotide-disulfide oxidoreductase [Aliidongia dinghuensis]|uniref:Pyridine nucleotide-disulfide oxidoreductase n=1 Tax=Aliidongia dinghuensis TaxID=1867774 RepID=A0A8J3E610_9PROT|nr:FAD-dependent oxidoreductase [Aliidongia dinghuensis]GGF39762.1 pyridine nucleotide-disulfide oxidoreductase [Aliidongia dinghuensis]
MKEVDFLLLGGGLANATAAETLRLEGAKGSILLLSAEDTLPYHRPPLSKEFLRGEWAEDRVLVYDAAFYAEQGIETMLGTRAVAVDPARKIVSTDKNGEIAYGQLLIATGARPYRLDLPNANLAGIYNLRTLADSAAIRAAAETAKNAVIIGGSFLSLEVATALRRKGVRVTVVEFRDTVFPRLRAPSLSAFFHDYCYRNEVDVMLNETVAKIVGRNKVSKVVTRSGSELPCDLLLVAIGVQPETSFLDGSGLDLDNGILVDRHLQSSNPAIFAAGDVANFFDPVFNRRRRIEHWDNAIKQGRLAARNMLGQNLVYDDISYFFCDVFDFSFEFLGSPRTADEHVGRGSLDSGSYALLYMKDNVPRGLFTMDRPASETKAVEAMIRYRTNLYDLRQALGDTATPFDRLPAQTVLILQGGGALGAFEAGVVKAMEEDQVYPDIVAGVSIGAFNGAIIAGNPRHATEALESFWRELVILSPPVPDEALRRGLGAWQTASLGSPHFFRPRWLSAPMDFALLSKNWTSFYDTSPVLDLLEKYVDFAGLASSPVRLLVSAVNVETAQIEIFDSYAQALTPKHILASGSLPPAFPWTTIDGRNYWDGGIVSNSPLELVIDRCGAVGKRVVIVDLFANKAALPTNLMEVLKRRDEILYAERIRNDVRTREIVLDFQSLVRDILVDVAPEAAERLMQRPRYIQLMAETAPMTTLRIARPPEPGEQPSRDYDFSAQSIEDHKQSGYAVGKQALGSWIKG